MQKMLQPFVKFIFYFIFFFLSWKKSLWLLFFTTYPFCLLYNLPSYLLSFFFCSLISSLLSCSLLSHFLLISSPLLFCSLLSFPVSSPFLFPLSFPLLPASSQLKELFPGNTLFLHQCLVSSCVQLSRFQR